MKRNDVLFHAIVYTNTRVHVMPDSKQSSGANGDARGEMNTGGDVVGRDKVTAGSDVVGRDSIQNTTTTNTTSTSFSSIEGGPTARYSVIGIIVVAAIAILAVVVVVINAYVSPQAAPGPVMIPIQATQTAEAKMATQIAVAASTSVTAAPTAVEIASGDFSTPAPSPTPPPLVIANFDDSCLPKTLVGGITGVTSNQPDTMRADYLREPARGCLVRLEYHIERNFVTFYLKLAGTNLAKYNTLSFDIRADPAISIPAQVKVELKRSDNSEVATYAISGITAEWQTISVPFASFEPFPLLSFTDMSELVFTFEPDHAGSVGAVYLDNILVIVR